MSHQTSVARPSIIAVSSWNSGFSVVLNAHAFASYPKQLSSCSSKLFMCGPKRITEESQTNWLIYKD